MFVSHLTGSSFSSWYKVLCHSMMNRSSKLKVKHKYIFIRTKNRRRTEKKERLGSQKRNECTSITKSSGNKIWKKRLHWNWYDYWWLKWEEREKTEYNIIIIIIINKRTYNLVWLSEVEPYNESWLYLVISIEFWLILTAVCTFEVAIQLHQATSYNIRRIW